MTTHQDKIWRQCERCKLEFYSLRQTVCEYCRKAEARRKFRAKKKLCTV